MQNHNKLRAIVRRKAVYLKMILLFTFFNVILYGAVAQLARAPALQAGGQEFDSPQLHQPIIHDKL